MKYFILTIIFFVTVIAIIIGVIIYREFIEWNYEKSEFIERLFRLRKYLQSQNSHEALFNASLRVNGTTIVYDRNGRIIGVFAPGIRHLIPLNKLSSLFVRSLLAVEDRWFYYHPGIGTNSYVKSLWYNLRSFPVIISGKSISQRLAALLLSDKRRSFKHTLDNYFCAQEIKRLFTKDEILELYVNSIYFGHRIFGIKDAALFYFNKEPLSLDIIESALLIGIKQNPSRFSPITHPVRAKRQHRKILNQLIHVKLISSEEAFQGYERFWKSFKLPSYEEEQALASMKQNTAPYLCEYVRQFLMKQVGEDRFKRGGLKVYTTFDLTKQNIALKVLQKALRRQTVRSSKLTGIKESPVEGAIVALNPHSGEIFALVGGSRFSRANQFNRAIDARRQIGSAFKPFVFAAAIEYKGYHSSSKIHDQPIQIKTKQGIWHPKNYNNRYYGEVTLEFALKKSLNSVSIQLLNQVGIDRVIEILSKSLDIPIDKAKRRFPPYLSAALGVYTLSPLELAHGYGIFSHEGQKIFPYAVKNIVDKFGNILVDNEGRIRKTIVMQDLNGELTVIHKSTAHELSDMLKKVLEKGGTAHSAIDETDLDLVAHGKTGTTNNYADAWFVGYTNDLLVVVWVGYDDPSYSLGEGQTGGKVAAPIWVDFITSSLWNGFTRN